MLTKYKELKEILREMFQMDQANLDFGIYRIMNAKRTEIEKFLDDELLPQVKEEFGKYRGTEIEEKKKELITLEKTLQDSGINPDDAPKVKALREDIAKYGDDDALANEVFSHLSSFFRRYYVNGDFLSLRRYKKDIYAIPYEGEEIKLYYANSDQFYIKTSEYLKDYTFKLSDNKRVHFKLVDASQEKDNIKTESGKDRKFRLYADEPVRLEGNDLIIQFVYLSDKEKQDNHNKKTFEFLKTEFGKKLKEFDELFSTLPIDKNSKRTLIEKHLSAYTARFNFDFFIHKDLGGFLNRELDFYIKNEVLFIDDLDAHDNKKLNSTVARVKVIKHIASKVITFLAQLEDFQKKLWLKKKFVVACGYCVTLDRVPEAIYPEIIKNDNQREEWVNLFAIDKIEQSTITPGYSNPLTLEFLKANPYLVLDTIHFNEIFKEKLLASFENLDEATEGVIINSENFQALNLFLEKYKNQVKYIHIDPPYNTETSGFVYKNNYQHSSWLSMMEDRISLSLQYLLNNSCLMSHIDENEYEVLHQMIKNKLLDDQGTIVWDKRNPVSGASRIATQHEYIVCFSKGNIKLLKRKSNGKAILEKAKGLIRKYDGVNEVVRNEFKKWIQSQIDFSGGERAYCEIDNKGEVYQSVHLGAPEQRTNSKFFEPLIHPITHKQCPVPKSGWGGTPDFLKDLVEKGEILFGKDETVQPRRRYFLKDNLIGELSSVIYSGEKGKSNTQEMGLEFPYCHPTSLYEDLIWSIDDKNALILDYFGGSGTTGHAVINLNREDGGCRKYILVEMGEHFNTALKIRIQKAIYCKEWKDGKPISRIGISHMFKYLRLEGYDDTLDNLLVNRTEGQQKTLEKMGKKAREEYMISYLLDIETKASVSLLSIDQFSDPLNYTLKIRKDNELKDQKVDLIETFNYLVGLYVEQSETIRGFKVIRGKLRTGEKSLIIWRNTQDKTSEDLNEFFKKQKYNTLDFEFDLIFVNGDNNLENLKVAEDKWKVRLIEEEFKRRMFEQVGV